MLAIIGGTGLYALPALAVTRRIGGTTPFGQPSADILQGTLHGQTVLFLARHGQDHQLLPHEVNYRANLYALKRAGARAIVSLSAVGSLTHDAPPGALAIPEQYFDWTRGRRAQTFFGDGLVAHVSTARPVSPALVQALTSAAQQAGTALHCGLTYACVEGPRLGTRAESFFLRQAGCHLVGMTNIPEVFLAREAQMAYATIALVTDYDCWLDDPAEHATVAAILQRYAKTVRQAEQILDALLRHPLPALENESRQALQEAILTAEENISATQREWLAVLRQ